MSMYLFFVVSALVYIRLGYNAGVKRERQRTDKLVKEAMAEVAASRAQQFALRVAMEQRLEAASQALARVEQYYANRRDKEVL